MGPLAILTDAVLKSGLLLLAAGGVSLTLRRGSAAVRHLIWTLGIIGALALPVLSGLVPEWRTPLPAAVAGVLRSPSAGRDDDHSEPRVASGSPKERGHRLDAAGESLDAVGAGLDAVGAGPDAMGAGLDAIGDSVDAAGERIGSNDLPAGGELIVDAASQGSNGPEPAASPAAAIGPPRGREGAGASDAGGGAVGFGTAIALGVLWASGAAAVLLLLLVERIGIRRLSARSRWLRDGWIADRAVELSRLLGLRRAPRLLRSEAATMPMTWGVWGATVLLPADVLSWSDERIDAVLLHELAHVRRRDYLTQLLAGLACSLYWFNPLIWLAARRLRIEREHACDDAVLRAGSLPSNYAEQLLEIARYISTRPALELSVTTMARRSGLKERLLAVLDERRDRRAVTRRLAASGAALLMATLVPLAAVRPAGGEVAEPAVGPLAGSAAAAAPFGVQTPSCWHPKAPHSSRVSRGHEGVTTLLWYNDECRVEVEVRGELEFADDFTRIAGISQGGLLRLREEAGGVTRQLEVRPGPEGRPSVRWLVEGEPREFDEESRAWVAERLVPLIRLAGLAVEQRVAWILERRGVGGVLDETRLIAGDGLQGEYLLELIERADLRGQDLEDALAVAAEEIGSDSRMARFLAAVAEREGESIAASTGFWEAAGTVGSDSEQAEMLMALVARVEVTDRLLRRVLRSATEEIGSDSEMAHFLVKLASAHPDVGLGAERDEFWAAVATVGSDSEQRVMLLDLLDSADDDSRILELVLRSASRGIGSDSEMAGFLIAVGERYPALVRGDLRELYLRAAATVGSDSEHRRVMSALAEGLD
jgi:beta-lactamase regulating signal transducer with metallopeptidase domain